MPLYPKTRRFSIMIGLCIFMLMLILTIDMTDVTALPPQGFADQWQPLSQTNAPTSRRGHTMVWTGSEFLIWGGETGLGGYTTTNTGARYNPVTDSWAPISTVNAPSHRRDHSAIWTGTEMIVWGGVPGNAGPVYNTGGRYNPLTDSWTLLSTVNAPSARHVYGAIWTGSEMIVWGGGDLGPVIPTNTGGRYNPTADSWTPISTVGAPSARFHMSTVWSGTEMIVWGGAPGCCGAIGTTPTGGRYSPQSDTWTPMAAGDPDAGFVFHTGIWSGTELIVWGGYDRFDHFVNTGQRYDPATDSWTPMSANNAPSRRGYISSVWAGQALFVWGGYDGNMLDTGGYYIPATDSWISTASEGAPSKRDAHTMVWTGNEVLLWGGFLNSNGEYLLNTGSRYQLSAETAATPTATSTNTAIPEAMLTATPSPIPTKVFDVAVKVLLSTADIQVGDTITAQVTVNNQSIGCQYPVYDITLSQEGDTVFRFDSPTVLGPPGPNPALYTLTAVDGGTVTLVAAAYGERYCEDFWQWTYIYGTIGPLEIKIASGPTVTPTPPLMPTIVTITPTATLLATVATAAPTPTATLIMRNLQYLPVIVH